MSPFTFTPNTEFAGMEEPFETEEERRRRLALEAQQAQQATTGVIPPMPAVAQPAPAPIPQATTAPVAPVAPTAPVAEAPASTMDESMQIARQRYEQLLRLFNGDEQKAMEAYREGPAAVRARERAQAQAPAPTAAPTAAPQPAAAPSPYSLSTATQAPQTGMRPGMGVAGLKMPQLGQPGVLGSSAQYIDQYQQSQDNPQELLKLREDQSVPAFIRERASNRAYDILNQEYQQKKSEAQAQQLMQQAAGGDRRASNTIAKELQNQQGSWMKYALLKVFAPDLAGDEAAKLGFGSKWQTVYDANGTPAMIEVNAKGMPLQGYKADGTAIPTNELVKYAGGGKRDIDIVGGSYVNDRTGEVGRLVTDKRTGQSYIQTDTGRKPMTGFRPQSSGGTLDAQRVAQVQRQNIQLAGDWQRAQMAVQQAGPQAANKFLGEFNQKYGTNFSLQSLSGVAPQIDINTGQIMQAAPRAQTAPTAAPAQFPTAPVAPQAMPMAEPRQAAPAPAPVAPAAVAPAPVPAQPSMAPTRPSVAGKSPQQIADEQAARAKGEEKAAVEVGEDIGKAKANQISNEETSAQIISDINTLLKHPGFESAVGSKVGEWEYAAGVKDVPFEGTDAYDFHQKFNTYQGKTFLEQFNKLRGGGQITEAEGRKATEAFSAINLGSTEEQFVREALRAQEIVKRSVNNTRKKLGQKPLYENVMSDKDIDKLEIAIRGDKIYYKDSRGWRLAGGE